ncbi:MAG: PEP-CTERM sorting domain-containing protein [Planctomycetota bacterium]
MFSILRYAAVVSAISLVTATAAQAQTAEAQFFDVGAFLSGTTDFDGWDDLSVNNPNIGGAGYPGFTTAALPWPAPIDSYLTNNTFPDTSDDDVTGDAQFNKTSGFGYPASSTIYSTPFANGTYTVTDSTPLAGLETVVFQAEIGSGSAGWLAGTPTLTVNGSTVAPLAAAGTVDVNFDPAGPFGPLSRNTFLYQWDVSGLGTINDFAVDFGLAGTSATIWALQLDQGSTFAQVPEPSSVAGLAGLGLLGALGRRRRRS